MKGVVVGCGRWGANHLRVLKKMNVSVSGCDIVKSKACQEYEVSQFIGEYKDYDKYASNHDFVVVSTPPTNHFCIALEALFRGKHVLVEKPYVMTAYECDTLNIVAKRIQKVIHVDLTFLYDDGFKKLLELKKELGQIKYILSKRLGASFHEDISVVWNLAIHDIYMSNEIMDPFPLVKCNKLDLGPNTSKIELEYSHGGKVDILVSWDHPVRSRSFIIGSDKGIMEYNIDISDNIQTSLMEVKVNKEEALVNLYNHFFERIEQKDYMSHLSKYTELMNTLLKLK